MFKAPSKEPAPVEKPPKAKAPRVVPRKRKNNAYLVWILAASGVLLIIAIIVFFALRD
jgi:uncharacterized integral membrane protein